MRCLSIKFQILILPFTTEPDQMQFVQSLLLSIAFLVSMLVADIHAFSTLRSTRLPAASDVRRVTNNLQMNFFAGLLGPKKTATARHILVSGPSAETFLTELKGKLSKSKDLKKEFADSAMKYSTCPSSKNGGSLGTFKQGAMVPAFDRVVFSEELNTVHGPVKTPFGAHLILIESRSS